MASEFDTVLLRSFVAAIRTGAISRAAAVLNRTQPAISQHVRRLEERLGKRLLVRSNAGVAPTVEGERLLALAERILDLADAIPQALSGAAPTGPLRIGLAEELVSASSFQALEDLGAVYPGLAVEPVLRSGAKIAEQAARGGFDLWLNEPRLHAAAPLRAVSIRLVWAAVPRFDARISPLPMLLWRAPCAWRNTVTDALDRAGLSWKPAFEATSIAALHAAARDGLGLTVAPAGRIPPGLVRIDLPHLPEPSPVEVALYGAPVEPRIQQAIWRLIT
jgi:DNA-binding transcriptional LysR family regulator